MSDYDFNDNEEPSFFQKYRFVIVGFVVLLIAGSVGLSAYLFTGKIPPPRKPVEITISLPPPPPPPPPPPTPPPPKIPPPPEPKMVEQPPIKPNEKPKDVAKAPDKAPGPPGKPSGPASDAGIGDAGGGGGGTIGGGNGGSRFGWYGAKVQDAVRQALSQNSQTRHARFQHLKVHVWIDPTGRITRATLTGSSGDSTVDDALKNQAFNDVRLSEPPPQDMPMPVVMTIDEERP